MQRVAKGIIQVVGFAAILFAIGLATRIPAIAIGTRWGIFGAHAMVAAFFYGLLVAFADVRLGRAWPLMGAAFLYGAVMWSMSPVMGLGATVPAVVFGAVTLMLRTARIGVEKAAVAEGVAFAGASYVAIVVAGAACGMHVFVAIDLLGFVMSMGLGLLGALLGAQLVSGKRSSAEAKGF